MPAHGRSVRCPSGRQQVSSLSRINWRKSVADLLADRNLDNLGRPTGQASTGGGLAYRSPFRAPRPWTTVPFEASNEPSGSFCAQCLIHRRGIRQGQSRYGAYSEGGRRRPGSGLSRLPPGSGSRARHETTSGQGWCPEVVSRLTNLRGRACQQIRYCSRLSASDAASGRSRMSFGPSGEVDYTVARVTLPQLPRKVRTMSSCAWSAPGHAESLPSICATRASRRSARFWSSWRFSAGAHGSGCSVWRGCLALGAGYHGVCRYAGVPAGRAIVSAPGNEARTGMRRGRTDAAVLRACGSARDRRFALRVVAGQPACEGEADHCGDPVALAGVHRHEDVPGKV